MYFINGSVIILASVLFLSAPMPFAQAYSTQLKILRPSPEDLLNQGQALADQGYYQGAIAIYNQAIEADPAYTEAYINRGLVYHDMGNYDQAISDFTEALAIDPDSAEAYNARGETRTHVEDVEGAIADLKPFNYPPIMPKRT